MSCTSTCILFAITCITTRFKYTLSYKNKINAPFVWFNCQCISHRIPDQLIPFFFLWAFCTFPSVDSGVGGSSTLPLVLLLPLCSSNLSNTNPYMYWILINIQYSFVLYVFVFSIYIIHKLLSEYTQCILVLWKTNWNEFTDYNVPVYVNCISNGKLKTIYFYK